MHRYRITIALCCFTTLAVLISQACAAPAPQKPKPEPRVIQAQGREGTLAYATTERGDRVPDFSYAGYAGGDQIIPNRPVRVVVSSKPGDQTARYLEKILTRLTLAGAAYVTLVCLLPEFLILKWGVPFYFGGTSLLIIVVVTMDFMAQVQAYVMTHQYESLLRKANFKGGMPAR